ncbi:DNA-processing protein DprA [Pseudomonas sp. NBRC 111140]|uniref:DNA-processing protein DprA n=1 Tax=Pseudomonas sp. NBRC 111140 TaxID=1661055 RepID=UPI000761DDA2|nr:DNA-processing protein DprA [Pseudomonas sp. NBRC 111140]
MEAILESEAEQTHWRREKIAFLALSTIKGLGFWSLHKIAISGRGFNSSLRNPDEDLLKIISEDFLQKSGQNDLALAQENLWSLGLELAHLLNRNSTTLIFKNEDGFPRKLKATKDSPEWLFVQGDPACLHGYSIAIVGTREPTDDGILLTKTLVAGLNNFKLATISGLAAGIDQTAHLESVRYDIPTIAVLGTGIFLDYPKGSDKVRQKIIDNGGCVITEYLPNQKSSAENFVRRNRIQAALCDTLIPVEWKIKSGTAHTVGFASKYNRKIANVYLPKTYSLRAELAFSEAKYGAESFEMPTNILNLLRFAFFPKIKN